MPGRQTRMHPENRCTTGMTDYEICLAYFQRFQREILERLGVSQPAEAFSDDERVGLADQYLRIVSE